MLEILIFGGGDGDNYLPNSGPGNKRLIKGSKDEGWLGLVDVRLMPSIFQAADRIGLNVTPFTGSNTAAPRWFKAIIDGKAIFFPNGPWVDPLNFTDIYYKGGVYGVDGVGPNGTPPSNVGGGVNQLQYLDWIDPEGRAWLFKIRLIKGNSPVYVTNQSSVTTTSAADAEFWRLVGRVVANSTIAASDRWDNLVLNVDYKDSRLHDQTITSGYYHAVSDFLKPATGTWSQSGFTNSYDWRPVLEVVDPATTFVPPIAPRGVTPRGITLNPSISSSAGILVASDVLLANQKTIPLAARTESNTFIVAGNVSSMLMPVAPINPTLS